LHTKEDLKVLKTRVAHFRIHVGIVEMRT
jgi:hypothetical protein